MIKIFFVVIALVLLVPSIAMAVPVSYKGEVDYAGDITTGHVLKANSTTGTTQKTITEKNFLLNHLANKGEEVNFYFNDIKVASSIQPAPASIVDLGIVIVPGTPTIWSKTPDSDVVYITELESQDFSVVANDSRGADISYFWYKDGVLVSNEETYTFVGNNSNKGSNAGNYTISVKVYNGDVFSDPVSWQLNVERVRDVDGDGVPDKDDNCPYLFNPDQTDVCSGDFDGDGIDDTDDAVIGNETHMTTNVKNIELKIGDAPDLNEVFKDEKPVVFISGANTVVEFNFNFSEGSLALAEIAIQKQETNTTGSIIVRGINLTAQGKTKSVYVDKLNTSSDAVCVKDTEILSIKEISANCDGTDESLIRCDGTQQSGYTCTDLGARYKVTGLHHSGVREDSAPPQPQPGGAPPSPGGGGGGGGAPASPGVSISGSTFISQTAGASATFEVQVRNTGTGSGTYTLSISGIPSSWYSVSSPITLTAGSSGVMTYSLNLPLDATDSSFTVTATATDGATVSRSYQVSLVVLQPRVQNVTTQPNVTVVENVTNVTQPVTLQTVGSAFTSFTVAAIQNRVVQMVAGSLVVLILLFFGTRFIIARRKPWRTNYGYSYQQSIVDKVKKQVKSALKEEE